MDDCLLQVNALLMAQWWHADMVVCTDMYIIAITQHIFYVGVMCRSVIHISLRRVIWELHVQQNTAVNSCPKCADIMEVDYVP